MWMSWITDSIQFHDSVQFDEAFQFDESIQFDGAVQQRSACGAALAHWRLSGRQFELSPPERETHASLRQFRTGAFKNTDSKHEFEHDI